MSKSTSAPSFLALSCVGAIAFATAAHAQEAEQTRKLGGVTVTDSAIEEPSVKVEKPASPKYTAPLADTPQTITVVSRANIDQQNLLTLREVLSTVPGITYTAGENGNGYADNINIMGVDARNDITVNGVRSSSNLNRNETYNIEQVEVTTGANSVYNGGGNVAGSINLVTKQPTADNKIQAQAGIGTDNYYRATVDVNRRLNDLVAVRLNAVYHQNDVPGRDEEYSDRWGIAPSVKIGLDGPTSLVLQYEHLTDHAIPQYGVPYFAQRGGILEGFSRAGYYGLIGADKQDSKTNAVQSVISHEFSDKLRLRSLSRYENILQETITTNPSGNYCLAGAGGVGYNPAVSPTAAAGTSTACSQVVGAPAGTLLPAGYYQSSSTGSRAAGRNYRNETLSSQLDLSGTLNTGSIEHTFNVGASYLWEHYNQLALGNVATIPAGGWPVINIANPSEVVRGPGTLNYGSNHYTGALNQVAGTRNIGRQEVFAGYLFDTIKFADWLQFNGGIRYEKVKGNNYDIVVGATDISNNRGTSNNLFSYRGGLVIKPIPTLTLYVAHGTAKRGSQAAVSSGCTNTSTTGGNTCTVKPETTKTYEIGVKAELFNKGLMLSAAAFRNDRDTIRVASGEIGIGDLVLDGKERAQGFTLGAVGNVTPEFAITANFMYVDAFTRQSVSDFCLRNPGITDPLRGTCTNSVAVPDPLAGSPTASTPETSGNIFLSYILPAGFDIGYGANYQGSFALNRFSNTTPGALLFRVPSYVTQRLVVGYKVNANIRAQINVQNLFNEKYVTTVRTATGGLSWGQPGASRSAVLSLTGTF